MPGKFIDYDSAHRLVDSFPNLFWDGWTIVDWRPSRDAFYKKNGLFREGKWGVAKRYSPSKNGWEVPARYVDE